jgi:hypothetical protein
MRKLHKDDENMATPTKIYLTVNDTGIVHNKSQNEETAAKASEFLQGNHDVPSLVSSGTTMQKRSNSIRHPPMHNLGRADIVMLKGLIQSYTSGKWR